MTPREIILAQIHHRPTQTVPYTIYFDPTVEARLDEYYGDEPWRDKLLPYIASCGFVGSAKRQAKPISDTLSRDLFGTVWRTDKRPIHLQEPALKAPSLDGYTFPSAESLIPPGLKEAADKALYEYPDSFQAVGLGWGIWETYWTMRGFEDALMDSIDEPDFFADVLETLTEILLAHVTKIADIPGDAVVFGDDWSDQRGVMIGAARWRTFLKPLYQRVYQAAHAQGKLVISHCCGSVAEIMPDLIEIGLDVLESVQPEAEGMNPYELKKRWGKKIAFWGCLGSQSTMPFGTPQTIRDEVRRLCREMGQGGGYILAPAKCLQPETPTANAVALIETVTNQKR